jgi:heme exporter protein D
MLDLGPHASFILAAYGVTAIAVLGLVLITLADDRAQRRKLAELERQGVRRRSATPPKTTKPPKTSPAMTAPPTAQPEAGKTKAAKPAAKRKPAAKKTGKRKPAAKRSMTKAASAAPRTRKPRS